MSEVVALDDDADAVLEADVDEDSSVVEEDGVEKGPSEVGVLDSGDVILSVVEDTSDVDDELPLVDGTSEVDDELSTLEELELVDVASEVDVVALED